MTTLIDMVGPCFRKGCIPDVISVDPWTAACTTSTGIAFWVTRMQKAVRTTIPGKFKVSGVANSW